MADADPSDYCEPGRGLTGPRCRSCIDATRTFFDPPTASCLECPVSGMTVVVVPTALVAAVAAGALYLAWLWKRYSARRRESHRLSHQIASTLELATTRGWERASLLLMRLGLVAKAKLVLAYYQVVLSMPEAYAVRLPAEYEHWMAGFGWMRLNWLRLAAPDACFGDFRQRLQLKVIAPLVSFAAIVLIGALAGLYSARYH